MPTEFSPEWEYYVADSEVEEIFVKNKDEPYTLESVFGSTKFDPRSKINRTNNHGMIVTRYPNSCNTKFGRMKKTREERTLRKKCLVCGGIFEYYPSCHKNRKYCSHKCRGIGKRKPKSDKVVRNNVYAKTCLMCRCKFTPERSHQQLYCCVSCRKAGMRERGIKFVEERKCPRCDTAFKPKNNRTVYCSQKCGAANNGRKKSVPQIPCGFCGKMWYRTRNKKLYCSRKCSRMATLKRLQEKQ